MHPPDEDWASVRDDYVELYDWILTGIANDDTPDDARTQRQGKEIKERADRLRIAYRADAALILDESRAARIFRRRP
jgi:hypothetical protein